VDDEEDLDHFDLRETKVQSWESKDRTVVTLRISDTNGVCDMKVLLVLQAKVLQMQRDLGVLDELGERH
jgi:hypothetical protein